MTEADIEKMAQHPEAQDARRILAAALFKAFPSPSQPLDAARALLMDFARVAASVSPNIALSGDPEFRATLVVGIGQQWVEIRYESQTQSFAVNAAGVSVPLVYDVLTKSFVSTVPDELIVPEPGKARPTRSPFTVLAEVVVRCLSKQTE